MLKKVLIRFDSAWMVSQLRKNLSPMDSFLGLFSRRLPFSLLRRTNTECELVILDENAMSVAIGAYIQRILRTRFGASYANEVAQCFVSDYEADGDDIASLEKWQVPGENADGAEDDQPQKNGEGGIRSLEDMLADFKKSMQGVDGEKDKKEEKTEIPPEEILTEDALIEESEPSILDLDTEEEAPRGPSPEDVVREIDALVGAEDFKELANELVMVAPGLIKHNTVETLTHQSYLFAVNDGGGFSTYASLLAKLLQATELVNSGQEIRISELRLSAPGGNTSVFNAAMSAFRTVGARGTRMICIDISEWMDNARDKQFRDFLTYVDHHSGNNIVVFRVPFVEQNVLQELQKQLGDVLTVRALSFVPFDRDELIRCARHELEKRGFSVEEDAWQVYNARIAEEKMDGRFYGINTVRKVVREMIYRKQLDNACNGVDDAVIKKLEILSLAPTFASEEKCGLEILDDFVGMETIKSRVEEIALQIEMAIQNKELGSPCIHMRFVGNPGTGKTTVARVVGKLLKERGILRNGNFFEYAGRDFCGRYIGETAPKTATMCRDAYGSVLFIDEAYTLYRGADTSKADYGREAIDTLIAQMENHRNDLVVIMAGYTDEMETLMGANPGLESRMPYVIEFPNYTRPQLCEIFMRMTKRNFSYGEGLEEAVAAYFNSLPEDVLQSREFSNARFVRNLFERTWGKAYTRCRLNKDSAVTLEKEDFLMASGEKEFKKVMAKQAKRTLGFI